MNTTCLASGPRRLNVTVSPRSPSAASTTPMISPFFTVVVDTEKSYWEYLKRGSKSFTFRTVISMWAESFWGKKLHNYCLLSILYIILISHSYTLLYSVCVCMYIIFNKIKYYHSVITGINFHGVMMLWSVII